MLNQVNSLLSLKFETDVSQLLVYHGFNMLLLNCFHVTSDPAHPRSKYN